MTTTTQQCEALKPYTGKVLAWREDNGYDDSDFYALVWAESGPQWVAYASTRFYPGGFAAKVDATPEVVAAYAEWYAQRAEEVWQAEAEHEEAKVKVGSTVKVVKGKKYSGQEGSVTWFGADKFKSTRFSTVYRVKVTTSSGEEFYCPAEYCEVQTSAGWKPVVNARALVGSVLGGHTAAAFVLSQFPSPKKS